ncbi:protein phosphatase 2C domain-containing protein [Streptacidiphilus carbonis]|uniref:protein phosphatase 2C domain-containing protein n=1 Tax=Streptacidiphilus carbonis TaxID=105422 RepID=UPI0007C712E8|nr:protein phosphatase 2C domain-containing protein [Streptacidiphilus carbonis]
MQISHTSEASPDTAANEDFVIASERFAVVLDGATDSGLPNGCVHGVAWLAGRLGAQSAAVLVAEPELELRAALRRAIVNTRALHPDCDPTNPNAPSATVAVARERDGRLDCLVLADAAVVVQHRDGEVTVLTDDRVDRLPAYDRESVSRLRNVEGGFWVAGAEPAAADQALTTSLPLAGIRRFLLVSDGVSRLVERFGWGWRDVLDLVEKQGPAAAVRAVREAERAMPEGSFRGKRHDDATAAFGTPGPPPRPGIVRWRPGTTWTRPFAA